MSLEFAILLLNLLSAGITVCTIMPGSPPLLKCQRVVVKSLGKAGLVTHGANVSMQLSGWWPLARGRPLNILVSLDVF
jgi:hypothetical protein